MLLEIDKELYLLLQKYIEGKTTGNIISSYRSL